MRRTGVMIGGVAVLGILAVAAVLAAIKKLDDREAQHIKVQPIESPSAPPNSSKPSVAPEPRAVAAFPPDEWTHKELAAYLRQKGIDARVRQVGLPFTGSVPVAAILEGDADEAERPHVICYLCRDAQGARDQAGTMGADAFAVGRFAFGARGFGSKSDALDATLLKRIRAALKPV